MGIEKASFKWGRYDYNKKVCGFYDAVRQACAGGFGAKNNKRLTSLRVTVRGKSPATAVRGVKSIL